MSIPEPPVSLDNSCTVIHDNTLYSYSPAGFLSLRLNLNAEWEVLPMGETVTGAVCVGTTPPNAAEAAFFLVGGVSESPDYNGLQMFTYATGQWAAIPSAAEVTRNRRYHTAAYIQANNAIVVYAGTIDGTPAPSSQTFTIGASAPYEHKGAVLGTMAPPPGVSPLLLKWSDADVVLLGGDPANNKVYLFNPNAGWRDFSATLEQPLKDVSSMRAIIVDGADGSKSLIEFDMTASPNTVSRVVIQNAEGGPVFNSPPVERSLPSNPHSLDRRDLTLDNWPEYNSTLAPTETRSNYAMAQGLDNMVVFSGGNSEHPLRIYDVEENSWMNEAVIFNDQARLQASSTASSVTSTVASSTSTSISSTITSSASSTFTTEFASSSTTESLSPAFTSDAADSASEDNSSSGLSTNSILGITLGTILGFLAVLVVVLLLLRRRKRKSNHPEAARAGSRNEKPAASYKKDLPSTSEWRGHRQQGSQESFSSVAILMGRLGNQGAGAGRNSMESMHKDFKSTIGKPILQANSPGYVAHDEKGVAFAASVAEPRPRNGPLRTEDGIRRSSGWNRYWSGGSALQILGFGGPPQRNTMVSESSRYSEQPSNHSFPRRTQDSATVPHLNFEGRPGVSTVNTGSPVVGQQLNLKESMAGKIERPVSKASSGYSSGVPESVSELWDAAEGDKPWGANRAPSSAYTPSFYWGTPLAPAGAASSSSNTTSTRQAASGVSTQPQLDKAATSTDMSWLNLGDQPGR
ncbi:hypothetical protein B0I35DRAFT_403980 [Stachybotrys elegans]|uniref:Pre-mRNA splicing factor CLF1 n=1 Tax=Stachybotrys elegans TaxID=80388 RepID=A0A8K0WWG9_9HYPO|nr:hypothetical protein B0I35DRAFT_403980 [Stachybotrys elegans]